MARIDDVIAQVRTYLPEESGESLKKAYRFARQVHRDQKHPAGTPYMDHLLEVAYTLAAMKLDINTVTAAILHAVFKGRVTITEDDLAKHFGKDVATIVAGATRITNIGFNTRLGYQAENIRKLLLAMAKDIRVLLVRLADRLQDMFLLEHYSKNRQRQVAQETLDLYAPLASRLGIDWIKRQLEDLSFKYLHPVEYKDLVSRVESGAVAREAYVTEVLAILRDKLAEEGIQPVRILGRPKHIYSIYKKLQAQAIPLEKVYDRVAFRIIVRSNEECYTTLAALHKNWQSVPGRFKDFISVPKANNYQSIHTTVVGPRAQFMEVQIRTEKMDRVAQEGIAAHWAYKEQKKISEKDAHLFKELKEITRRLQEVKDPKEFIESVKSELDTPDVYVLTPNGEVKGLPQGSTPIDFAYAIHSEVGDHCSGARVNGKIVPLRYELKNGDSVEIITSVKQFPRRGWLTLARTSRARARIRHYLRRAEHQRYVESGREICERVLQKHHLSLKKILRTGHVKKILQDLGCAAIDTLLYRVGTGQIPVSVLERAMQPEEIRAPETRPAEKISASRKPKRTPGGVVVDGMDGIMVRVSQCCRPLPGDAITGFITTGSGVSIHKAGCAKLLAGDPSRRVDVHWSDAVHDGFKTLLSLDTEDKKGILAEVSTVIAKHDADISDMSAHGRSGGVGRIDAVVVVANRAQLDSLVADLRKVPGILRIERK